MGNRERNGHGQLRVLDGLPKTEVRAKITCDPATVERFPVPEEEVGQNRTLDSNAVFHTAAETATQIGKMVWAAVRIASILFHCNCGISLHPQSSVSMRGIEHGIKETLRYPQEMYRNGACL